MSRACSVCAGARAEIEAALSEGASYREIQRRFTVSPSSLSRHRRHSAASPDDERPSSPPAEVAAQLKDLNARLCNLEGWAERSGRVLEDVVRRQARRDFYR